MGRVVAFYDALKCPLTYDFAQFASAAKTVAGDRPLHFVFVPRPDGSWSKPNKFSEPEAEYRRLHIVLELAPLFGATYTVCQNREHARHYETFGEAYPTGYTVDKPIFDYQLDSVVRLSGLPRRGPAPSAKALNYARQYLSRFKEPVISVTIRRSRYPIRDTNLDAWLEFAGNQRDVVFIPDTDTAFQVDGACVQAAVNVDIRLAIYSLCKLNCFTSNGCAMPLIMTDIPYLFFKAGADGYMGKEQWDKLNIPYGTQPNFCVKGQKWIWEPDNLDVIRREVEDFHRLG